MKLAKKVIILNFTHFHFFCTGHDVFLFAGKHGQTLDRSKRDVVVSTEGLAQIQTDTTREIKSYVILTQRAVAVNTEPKAQHVQPFKHGSLPLAIQVTAAARVFLLECILRLEDNGYMLLYADTGEQKLK